MANASRWELEEFFEKVIGFLDGRDLTEIPRQEVWDFIGMHEKRKTLPATSALRLVCMYELDRMRNDSSYANSVEVRTLRNLWYEVVKPFLNRIEKTEHILQAKWSRKRSQVLSAVLSEMVLSGMCRYKDFNIEDRSRPKRRPGSWNKLQVGRFDEVILFIEKDSQFPRIETLADLLGFTVECGKGQQATAAIEGLIDSLDDDVSYLVFLITDYDYYGHLIGKSMSERVETLGIDATFVRVGVDLEQVPYERQETAKFLLPMASDAERDWALRYAIEGRYGLEIEALTARELRKAIADAVYEHCDHVALYDYLMEKALEGLAGEVADFLSEEDDDVIELRGKISELEKELREIRRKLIDALRPLADRILEEKLDEIDEREDFPHDWLMEQIADGQTFLDESEYTDPREIKKKLIELVRDHDDEEAY